MNKNSLTGVIASKPKGSATISRGLVLVCMLLPAASWAQGQAQATEQIVVTGTRLPNPNLVSTSPIQVVTAEEIAISGRNDVSDILQMLPQNFSNDLGQDLGNRTSGLTTAGGVATADLRGLGPNRTLVLVNGRRLGNGSPYTVIQSPAPDLDQIPARLIERVEVVTGGASAVYGSDAVAGVVNFITKKGLRGHRVRGTGRLQLPPQRQRVGAGAGRRRGLRRAERASSDGRTSGTTASSAASTAADGRGNITLFLGYQTQDGVRSNQRDFGAGQLFTDTDDDGVPTGTSPWAGRAIPTGFSRRAALTARTPRRSIASWWEPVRAVRQPGTTPPAVFNSQKDIYMSRQYNRANAGLIGHYDLSDRVKPYVEFNFMNDKTHQEIAPSACSEKAIR